MSSWYSLQPRRRCRRRKRCSAIEEGAEFGRCQLAAALAGQRGAVERRWIAERHRDQAVGIDVARIEQPEQRVVVEGACRSNASTPPSCFCSVPLSRSTPQCAARLAMRVSGSRMTALSAADIFSVSVAISSVADVLASRQGAS